MSDAPNTRAISTRRRKSLNDVVSQSGAISKRLYHGESGAQSGNRMRRVADISNRYIRNILRAGGSNAGGLYDYIMGGGRLNQPIATQRYSRNTYAR